MVRDNDDFEDDISVLELPIEESYNKEPSSPAAAGIGNTANSESESKSSHVSDAVEGMSIIVFLNENVLHEFFYSWCL